MNKAVMGTVMSLILMFGALAAVPNTGPIPVQVSQQATPSGYTGAASEATLISDFEAAAGTYKTSMACWPLNDAIGALGTDFVQQCNTGPANDITFGASGQANSSGFTTQNTTPVIATAADAVSVNFGSQSARMPSQSTLPSGTSWTVSFGINPGSAPGGNVDIGNTGNPTAGTGAEFFTNSTGHTSLSLGKGSGSGATTVTSTNADSTGNHSKVFFVSWAATGGGAGTVTLYDYDETTKVLSTVSSAVTSYSATSYPMGIVYPFSGSTSGIFTGNMEWVSYIPTALNASTVSTLITDLTGTQPPVVQQTPDPGAPTTFLSYPFSKNLGFDSEFSYSSVGEQYATAAGVRNLQFMGVNHLRDDPGTGSGKAPYDTVFCNNDVQVIGFSRGFNAITAGTLGVSGETLLTTTDVTNALDEQKTNQGCYPQFIEPENEIDDSPTAALASNDPAYPGDNIPMWASLIVEEMHTIIAARNSNAKYAGVKVFGPGLANTPSWPTVSEAWRLHYGTTVPAIDVAVQHTNPNRAGGPYAADDPSHGIDSTQLNQIYAADSTGFSFYSTTNKIPQTWDEVGIGLETSYYASGNDIDNPMAVHYVPRDLLRMFSSGISGGVYFDFLFDKPYQVLNKSFTQVGWTDEIGNLKAGSYAGANLEHLVGYNNNGSRTTPTQLNFSVKLSNGNAPTNIAKYTFQNDDGSYWIIINDPSSEGTLHPNASPQFLTSSPVPQGVGTCQPSNEPNDPCYNIAFQGAYYNPVGFTTVTISGLPAAITHAAVYQNDEYCNNTMTQDTTPFGDPLRSYSAGANTDCEQWWPAGSIQHSVQSSYRTVTGGVISGNVLYNGMPLAIHVGSTQLYPVATATPMPFVQAATPGPGSSIPTTGPTQEPTPVPSFGPPTSVVPTPPQ